MEIPISALRILCIDDLQLICDEFEACEAETESHRLRTESLSLRLSSHIDLSVEANTNLYRKRKANMTDMKLTNATRPVREYIVRVCGGGHGGMQSVSIAVALKKFRQVKKNFNVTMEIMHPEDRRNFGNVSEVITWLQQSDFHVISTHIHQGCNVVLFDFLFSRMSFFFNVTQAISRKPRRIGIFASYWNKFSGL